MGSEEVLRLLAHDKVESPTLLLFGQRACRACRTLQPSLQRLVYKHNLSLLRVNLSPATKKAFIHFDVKLTPLVAVLRAAAPGDPVEAPLFIEPQQTQHFVTTMLDEIQAALGLGPPDSGCL